MVHEPKRLITTPVWESDCKWLFESAIDCSDQPAGG